MKVMQFTYSSWPSCKYLSFFDQDLFCMMVVVHNQDFVGAHHEGIKISIFLLQLLEEDVWRTVSYETEETPDDGE